MEASQFTPREAPKSPKSVSDRATGNVASDSESDGSASIDEDDLSESESEDYHQPARKGGSRRTPNKSPQRKRRKRPEWTRDEEETVAQVHCSVGNQWSFIASRLPGRTANEVKNIWHSTLRSKHLKARSLLRAYATALNSRWDDEAARQEAYDAALRQHGVSCSRADPTAEAEGLQATSNILDDEDQTPRLGAGAGFTGAGELPSSKPAQGHATPDRYLSPPATLVRQRGCRGSLATAPRPATNTGRGGHLRNQQVGSYKIPQSPSSCPAKGPQGQAKLLEMRGGPVTEARCALDGTTTLPLSGYVVEGAALPLQGVPEAVPANENACAAVAGTNSSRPLPLSLGWAPQPQLPQRLWPLSHLQQAGEAPDFKQQQPPSQKQQHDAQQQESQQQPLPQSPYKRPCHEVQLLQTIGVKSELKEGHAGDEHRRAGHRQMLGIEPHDTWLGQLDPLMVMHDDEAATGEQLCRRGKGGGAGDDSDSSGVVRAVSASAAAAPGCPTGDQRPNQQAMASGELTESGRTRAIPPHLLGKRPLRAPDAIMHHGRAGPTSGAWSSNSGAMGPLPLPPPASEGGAANLQHAAYLAAGPKSAAVPMAISPTGQDGGAGEGSTPISGAANLIPGHLLKPPAGMMAGYGSFDPSASAPLSYEGIAGGYVPMPDTAAEPEGHGRFITESSWALDAMKPQAPLASRPTAMGLKDDAWLCPFPTPQLAIRCGSCMPHASDAPGGMHMIPVEALPTQPHQPQHMVFGAPPPHVLPLHAVTQQYELFGGPRMRSREHIMCQHQQYLQQQINQHEHELQQLYYEQQFRQIVQHQQVQQQTGERQQQQQFKSQPQEEQVYRPFEAHQQQQLEQQRQQQQQQMLQSQQASAHQQLQSLHSSHDQSQPHQLSTLVGQRQGERQQQHEAQQSNHQQQALEQHADSLSSSDVVTMGLDSLRDPQLRWCLMGME